MNKEILNSLEIKIGEEFKEFFENSGLSYIEAIENFQSNILIDFMNITKIDLLIYDIKKIKKDIYIAELDLA